MKTILIIGLTLLALGSTQQIYAIYEDQSFICKQNNHIGIEENTQLGKLLTCTIVNDDNVFSDKGINTLDTQFTHQLDVFGSEYLREID